MWHLTWANAVAHRSRLALTWVAVALGVAFVVGSLVLTDTSSRVLDDQFRTSAAGVDLTVRSGAAFDSAMGVEVERDPLPVVIRDRVATAAGVKRVRPVASGNAQLQIGGTTLKPKGPTLLSSWGQAPFTAYTLRQGAAPARPDEVALDVATARTEGVHLGDTIRLSATTSRILRVVGLVGVGTSDGLANSNIVLTDLPTAQALLGLGNRFSSLEVIADDGTSVPQLRTQLAGILGRGYSVTSGQDAAAASADAAQQSIGYLRTVLLVLAAAGLVVGTFLIANTFGIVLAQRSRELAVLRAAGATGRQVLGSVLGEALLVGVTGAAGGTALGVVGAYGLRGLASSAGLALPAGQLTVTARTLLVGMLAGTVITVLAAVSPARRAARVAPVQAMRASDPAPTGPARGRRFTGWVLFAAGATLLGTGAVAGSMPAVGAGAAALLAALVILGPVLAPPLARAVGRPLTRGGVPGSLAREATVRNPRRTSATAMALALALALICFVSVLGSSVKAIAASTGEAVTADLMVQSSREEMLGGLSPQVAARVSRVPAVAATSTTRFGHWLDQGATSALTAVDTATLGKVVRVQMSAGSLADLRDPRGVIVAGSVATDRHLQVGDTLPMTFPRDGQQQMRVVGVMADRSAQALSTSYIISMTAYPAHYTENVDATIYVALAPGADITRARADITKAVADFPNAAVRDQAQAAAGRAAAIEQVISLITVLLGFAVLIALLGITNTLALSIVERTRELGLLRAVGMTRSQLRAMVRAEAGLVAAVAVTAGAALGLALAASALAALAGDNPVIIRVPVLQLLGVLAAAVLAGVAAGLLPARRAGRLDVLTAIATQ
ncbi:ABC transporter permease [Phycicoccus ginsengisoli]